VPQHSSAAFQSYRAPEVLGGAMIDGGAAIVPMKLSIAPDADGCSQPI
jgi:hypothetical protein